MTASIKTNTKNTKRQTPPHLVAQLRLVQPAVAGSKLSGCHNGHVHAACAHLLAQAGSEAVDGSLGGTLDAAHWRRHAVQAGGEEHHASMGAAHQWQEDLSQAGGSCR